MDEQTPLFDFEPKVNKFMEPLRDKGESAKRLAQARELATMTRLQDFDTSIQAAKKQIPYKLAKDRRRVYECHLENPDGLTDWELAELLEMEKSTAAKRRLDLCREPYWLIEKTSERRETNTGSPAIVWRVVHERGK